MPIYDYVCTACDHRADILHGINDPGPNFCPSCGREGTMKKQFAAPTIHYKGSGWAKKDRRATARSRSADPKADGDAVTSGADTKADSDGGSASAGSKTSESKTSGASSTSDGASPRSDGASSKSGGSSSGGSRSGALSPDSD